MSFLADLDLNFWIPREEWIDRVVSERDTCIGPDSSQEQFVRLTWLSPDARDAYARYPDPSSITTFVPDGKDMIEAAQGNTGATGDFSVIMRELSAIHTHPLEGLRDSTGSSMNGASPNGSVLG